MLDVPKPDYLDVEKVSERQIEDYITNYVIADYRRKQIGENIHSALKTLTEMAQKVSEPVAQAPAQHENQPLALQQHRQQEHGREEPVAGSPVAGG